VLEKQADRETLDPASVTAGDSSPAARAFRAVSWLTFRGRRTAVAMAP
jgi:hypothetical protein